MFRRLTSRFSPASSGLFVGLLCGWLASTAQAQLPITELNSLYPPGAKQGSTVEVTVAGVNHEQLESLLFSHPKITAKQKMAPAGEFDTGPKPVNNVFEVTVAADVPPGSYEARVVGRFGASNPRTFVVGSLDELMDDGSNKTPETAKALPVGTTINGRVDASSRDYFKVSLKAGQRIVIDCWAQRIDSKMNGTLLVLDAEGRELDRSRDDIGWDPVLDFTAANDGDYLIALYDFVYDGGADYAYRLSVHSRPHIDYVFPLAGLPGSNDEYTLYGRNLPGGTPDPKITLDGKPLETLKVRIPLPKEEDAYQRPILPPARTALLDGIAFTAHGAAPVHVGIARAPVQREQEPNDDTPQKITIPCDTAAQFYPARDVDRYEFEAKKGEVYRVEVISHQLGLGTDPYLTLQRVNKNEKGEETLADVAQVDDPGDRNGRIGTDFDTSTDDPSYRFQVPADGAYRIMVRDNFGGAVNDPRRTYRLVIRAEKPDFRLAVVPQQLKVANANQVLQFAPLLRKGGTTLLKLVVARLDGFQGEIDVTVEGLPAGVHCEGASLSAETTEGWLVFHADPDAKSWTGPITVLGNSKLDDQEVTRQARAGTLVWSTANRGQAAPIFRAAQDVVLSVSDQEPGVALVKVGDGQMLETSLGGKIDVPVTVTRYDGFKENLKLVATGMPAEIKPGDITVNGDKTDGKLALAITNAKAKPGVYTFFLRSDTKVKRSINPAAEVEAVAEQKRLTELLAAVNAEVKAMTTAQAAAVKALTDAANGLKAAQADATAKTNAVNQAVAAEKQAADQLAAAKQAAEKDTENAKLAEAVSAAEKAQAEAEGKKKAAEEAQAAAQKALDEATAKSKAATEAKTAADAKLKEQQEKAKRATAAKTAADKQLAAVKKTYAAKDINCALYSTPIRLRVVASPLVLAPPAATSVKQGEKAELPVTIERKYGFEDAVEMLLEVPKGIAGVSGAKLSIPKGQTAGKLEITAAKNATVGEHAATLRAKLKFNNISIDNTQPLTLKVEAAPEEPKKEAK